MSVMEGRALPDVRDGLKPVHRRILHAMTELGLDHSKPFRKCARVVGEVLGKYHPHGDQAVYDTLVRLAQPFAMAEPLVNGHGNFGSIDNDPAAAMRYTECRLQRLAQDAMLTDLDPAVVDFAPNFDGSCNEPTVLPARVPQLLINGSQGIAVGIATRIPPHNLSETVSATKALIMDPDASNEALHEHVLGPDFPTGGLLISGPGIKSTYTSGRGSMVLRASMAIEQGQGRSGHDIIAVKELPYQVYKSAVISEIAALVDKGTLEGISDIQDESDRRGMRIAIEVKRSADANVVLNNLLRHTRLQTRFSSNMVALVGHQPQQLELRGLLQHFIDFRGEVVTRRAQRSLEVKQARAHLVSGFLTAAQDIEAVVNAIRGAKDGKAAKAALQQGWQLSDEQADAVLNLPLRRLTGLAIAELEKEDKQLSKEIKSLQALLANKKKVMDVIIKELDEIDARYGRPRRTQIADASIADVASKEDLIPDSKSLIIYSDGGYIKRVCDTTFGTQKRGGRGKSGGRLKEDDAVNLVLTAMAHDTLLVVANDGSCFSLRAFDVPERSRTALGSPVGEVLPKFPRGGGIATIVPMRDAAATKGSLLLVSRQGKAKRLALSALGTLRQGTSILKLAEGDELCYAGTCSDDDVVFIACSEGKGNAFSAGAVAEQGRQAGGVIAKRLNKGHKIVGVTTVPQSSIKTASKEKGPWLLMATSRGSGKRVAVSELTVQKQRGGTGVFCSKLAEGESLVSFHVVSKGEGEDAQDCMLATDSGKLSRIPVSSFNVYSRLAKGVRVMRLQEGDSLSYVAPCQYRHFSTTP